MIRVEFETAVFWYLFFAIFGILGVWLLTSRIKLPGKDPAQAESIWQCFICTYIYVDSKHKRISLCPRCGSYNDRKEKLNGGG